MYRDLKPFKDYRMWPLKCFKILGLFMTVRHICSWQHQYTSKGWWTSKSLLMEFASHLSKKLLLSELLDGMLDKLDLQDPHWNDCWSCLNKVRQSFEVPTSRKRLWDILQDTEKSDWQTFNIDGIVAEISCLIEKSARYYDPVVWRWVPSTGSKMSLLIIEFWKLFTMHFLFS